MAEITTELRDGHPRTIVKLEPGERIKLCRCFASATFPLCDGTHREQPGKGPVVVQVAPLPESQA